VVGVAVAAAAWRTRRSIISESVPARQLVHRRAPESGQSHTIHEGAPAFSRLAVEITVERAQVLVR
jgi:hypothetical protein